jgi:hypothetical protein
MREVPHHEPIPEKLTDEVRATDQARTCLLAGAFRPEDPGTSAAAGRDKERRVYLSMVPRWQRGTQTVAVSAVDNPAPEQGDSVPVMWLVGIGQQVVVGLEAERSGQGERIEAKPVDVTRAGAGAVLAVRGATAPA